MLPRHKQQKSGPWLLTSSSSSRWLWASWRFRTSLGNAIGRSATDEPFESGIVTVGLARLRLSAKFYLIAVFFVIFDVEAVFLFAWAVAFRELGWAGYIEAVIFIAILGAALGLFMAAGRPGLGAQRGIRLQFAKESRS